MKLFFTIRYISLLIVNFTISVYIANHLLNKVELLDKRVKRLERRSLQAETVKHLEQHTLRAETLV